MTIDNLVINGCSYNEVYALGGGHYDLAKQLGINNTTSLALGGSANSRLIRTTLKHSYQVDQPTFYIVGLTFLHRRELAVHPYDDSREFEGCWVNPQAKQWSTESPLFTRFWTQSDTKTFVNLMSKAGISDHAVQDQLEDLMYLLLSLAGDLQARGHRILFYNQVDPRIIENLDHPRFKWFANNKLFVDGLKWPSITWQHNQGAPSETYAPGTTLPPAEYQHIRSGHHQLLNNFLVSYINEHKILA